MVLSDGTLVVPYIDFNFNPGRPVRDTSSTWLVTSSDGGLTFSAARRVFRRTVQRDIGVGGFASLAADTRSTRWRDHMYAAFVDMDGNLPRLMFTRSSDRGVTWSEPKPVSASVPRTSWQFQPALAVNDSGVVGLAWFDTRDNGDTRHYDQYFSASLDGGGTWLAPVRVSTASSDRFGAGNVRFTPQTFRTSTDSLRISFLSPAGRWGDGGDYMGLTADARGVFHPFWADSRTGTFQVMTADVRVETARPTMAAEKAAAERTVITRNVEVSFEPARYDAQTSTATLTIRLRNTSQQTFQGPLLLEIRGFGSGQGAEGQEFSPTVLNASNGKQGVGAVFDFTPALGTAGVLLPGAYTGSIELRMRLKDPLRTPDLHVEITGMVTSSR
ncbi:MAG: sialidase family protein [Longimicrobiales bacterium]